MIYKIKIAKEAERELYKIYGWYLKKEPKIADKWLHNLIEKIDTLKQNPDRCPLAPESETRAFEVRQLLYGKNRGQYRVLFTIEKKEIIILHCRHSSRDRLN